MAYTKDQLVTAYTNANLGKAPDQATTLTLDAYATQSQVGGISDATALANTLKLVNNTTAVAIETYQFFTGKAPSADGLAYLVNSTTNTNDLNDAAGVYAKFSAENRFINYAVDLGVNGEGAANFATLYGGTSVSYQQVVASAYDKIIGNATATAAGVDVNAAVAFFSRQANIDFLKAYLTANGYTDATKLDLAVKAALIGEILNAATVSGLGAYAASTAAMIADLSDGALTNPASASIFDSYPNAGGGVVGKTFALTTGIDPLVGTANDDTFTGTATATNNSNTANALDTIDGGAGVDTLNLSNAGGANDLTVSALSVKNVEVVNLTSTTGLENGALDTTAWSGLTSLNVVLADTGTAQAVTASGTTAVNLTASGVTADNVTVNGGGKVTVATNGVTTGALSIGATTAPTGIVTATVKGAYSQTGNVDVGDITIKGGTSVTVDQSSVATSAQITAVANGATARTVNLGDVSVTGTSATTAVTVTQAAAVSASNAVLETATAQFGTLANNASVTFNGLTFTNTSGATLAATNVAGAFANLAAGATTGAGAGSGTYSGTFGAYSTGAAGGAGTDTVTATATTSGNKTPDLASSTGVTVTVTQQGGAAGVIGVVDGAVTITDVNASSGTAAGKIATVTLANGTQTVASNALSTLNLSGTNTTNLTYSTTNTTTVKALTVNVAGGTSTVADTNGVLTSATVNSTADGSAVTLTGGAIATATLGGTKDLTFTLGTLGALKTVNTSGSSIVKADLSGSTSITKIDTTASTGSSLITIRGNTAGIAYNGGAGADSVTLTGAIAADASIKLGAGNDRLLSNGGSVASNSTAVIDGGDGVDAIASSLVTVGNAALFKNFEVLNLSSSGPFDISLMTGSTIQSLELNGAGATGSYGGLSVAQALNVTATTTNSDVTLNFTNATGTADAYTVTFNALTTGTSTNKATVAAGNVTLAGIETINVVSGSAGGVNTNTIALGGADARSVVITGSQAAEVSFAGTVGTTATAGLSSIDASGSTGGVKIDTSTGTINIATAGLTIKGGTGADNIIVGSLGASAVVTVSAGAGKDTINVGASAGVIGSGAGTAVHTTVTDFGSGDTLQFLNKGTETFTSTKIDVSTATDLSTALGLATQANGSTNGVISWFQLGGNTYVVENVTTAGFDAADVVVKLTGLVDLSGATLGATTSSGGPTLSLA